MGLENTTALPPPSRLSDSFSYVPESIIWLTLPTLAFWILLWKLRNKNDPTRHQDAIVFLAFLGWRCLGLFRAVVTLSLSSFSDSITATYFLAITVTGGAGLAVIRALFRPQGEDDQNVTNDHPWILPSRTTHTRIFPKTHSFAYSYLLVSVPVGFEGRCGSLISVGNVKNKGWLHVQGSDYLDRSSSETTLEAKLNEYLQSQVQYSPSTPYYRSLTPLRA